MFIAGVALISGMGLLRKYMKMKKSLQKQKTREYPRNLYATMASDFGLPASGKSTKNFHQAEIHQNDFRITQNVSEEEPTISLRSQYEQYDVELLTLSRQIKAEIDTKIVALQLMIADADRVMQHLGGQLSQSHQIAASTPHPVEPERMRILKAEETYFPLQTGVQDAGLNSTSPDPGDLKNLVIEDPFAVNDFGFDKAMRDLDQLSSSIPAFDAMPSLDVWDTPKVESPASLPNTSLPNTSLPNISLPNTPLPEWDTPLSYPISDDRPAQDRPTPQVHDTPTYHPAHNVASRTSPRKKIYTNKLLTQAPPQLDALMTDKPVGKMGSKPRRTVGQTSRIEDDSPVPPVIPKSPPPNAKALIVETSPFSQADIGADKISVRKTKRHQLQYLIDKGMSPKEIAAHLEMPVGEVELIFSLHNRFQASGERLRASDSRLQDEVAKVESEVRSPKPEARSETRSLKPEALPSKRRFKIIKNDDAEQVPG